MPQSTSSPTVEVHFLEGIDLEGAPPCEVFPPPDHNRPCPNQSAFRLKFTCCFGVKWRFVCQSCYDSALIHGYYCQDCHTKVNWVIV